MNSHGVLTDYERQLGYNFLTKYLHSLRYRHSLRALRALNRPLRILEVGCAEAKLFETLNSHLEISYTGLDIRSDFISTALKRYGQQPNFNALRRSAVDLEGLEPPDVVMALETLEHIPEHDVVRVVESIAKLRPALFLCSVPVEIGPAIWLKNVGSFVCRYNRHREYTWAETLNAGLYRLDRLPPHAIGHKGFDWRWLAQTIRHSMQIRKIHRFPAGLPAAFSTSVFFEAVPRS